MQPRRRTFNEWLLDLFTKPADEEVAKPPKFAFIAVLVQGLLFGVVMVLFNSVGWFGEEPLPFHFLTYFFMSLLFGGAIELHRFITAKMAWKRNHG